MKDRMAGRKTYLQCRMRAPSTIMCTWLRLVRFRTADLLHWRNAQVYSPVWGKGDGSVPSSEFL